MKTSIYTLAALLAFGLVACTNDEAGNPLVDGPVPLNVTASISQSTTRAMATAFEDGDQIGIFPAKDNGTLDTAQTNRLYAYSGSAFTSTAPYYFQDRGIVTFNAYYPYDAVLTATAHTIDIDTRSANQVTQQAAGNDWRKNDYLFASATTDVTSPSVSYTDKTSAGGDNEAFSHVMSQLVFMFKAGVDAGVDDLSAFAGYELATPLVMDGTFDAATGEVALDNGATPETIKMEVVGSAVAELAATPLILLPQTVTNNKIALEVKYNGQTYQADLTAPAGGLQSGYSYTYTVTISNTGLEVGSATINDWKQPAPEDFDGNGNATLQ